MRMKLNHKLSIASQQKQNYQLTLKKHYRYLYFGVLQMRHERFLKFLKGLPEVMGQQPFHQLELGEVKAEVYRGEEAGHLEIWDGMTDVTL